MRRTRTRPAGFTLVEMLTVIAIIVLLAGMLLPAVAEAQRRIHSTATRAQIRGIERSLDAYRTDWRSYPLSGSTTNLAANDDGARRLFQAIARSFSVNGNPYGPYYSAADDERSTALRDTWTHNDSNTGQPYIVDKIPPGMPILYFRANTGRAVATEVFAFAHSQNTRVRPGVPLSMHNNPAGPGGTAPGSPWNSTGGSANFYMFRAVPENTTWAEYPRWGIMTDSTANARPHKEESFLLISPGLDRKYGTRDDVRNYESQ